MLQNDRGASLVEQAIMLVLLIVVALGGISAFGGALNERLFDSTRQFVAGGGDANGQCNAENPLYPDC